MSNPAAFLSRAREVLARATPGPLKRVGNTVFVATNDRLGEVLTAVAAHVQSEHDAYLHVLAVNSLAALCDVVEAAALVSSQLHPSDGRRAVLDSALARLEVPE